MSINLFTKYNAAIISYTLLLLLLLAFSPPLGFFVTLIFGVTLSCDFKGYDNIDKNALLGVNFMFSVLFMLIYILSLPSFKYYSDDFASYYNNYLDVSKFGLLHGFLQFGFYEPLLPIVNFFISLIIDAPYPYLLKVIHGFLNIVLFFICVISIIKSMRQSDKSMFLLLMCMWIFYKLPQTLHLMRQGYACYFIILAIISGSVRSRFILLAVATLFHISSPLIYFFVKRYFWDLKSIKRSLFWSLLILILIGIFVSEIRNLSHLMPVFVYEKLFYIIANLDSDGKITRTLSETINALIYFIPALFISVFSKSVVRNEVFAKVIVASVFLWALSAVPGLGLRVMMPVFAVLIGYIYFLLLVEQKYIIRVLSLIFVVCFLNLNWIFNSDLFYYRFPMASITPFYYVDSLFESQDYIYRENLPETLTIENPYR